MIISRVKAGCFMVSGSIAVFGLAAILADDSLPETKAAALTPFSESSRRSVCRADNRWSLFRAVKQDLSGMRRKGHPFRG
jgi:hypothetical protein